MKLPIACFQCMVEKEHKSVDQIAFVEFRDDGRYEVTCPNGHTSITILQQQKFEILFDIGAYAIGDGYYREAVSSFTSSLERFYEFFVRAVLLERGVDQSIFDATWKHVDRQSERQLGAYIFLYVREFHKVPSVLTQKETQFRNDVIHRGKIPSRKEALAYGQAVLELVRPVLQDLKRDYSNGIKKAVFEHLKNQGNSPEERRSTISIATIISLTRADEVMESQTLEQAVTELRRWE